MGESEPLRYSDIEAAARTKALAVLSNRGKAAAAARIVIDTAEAFLAEVIERIGLQPQMAGIQCGAGCSPCCHQMVGVTGAELALMQEAIAAQPGGRRRAIRARIAETAKLGRRLNQAQWWQAKLRCPLLDDDGRCQLHSARPLPCRAMNSTDVEACRRSFQGVRLQIPILAAQHRIFSHAQAGLAQALAAAGLSPAPVVLALALEDAG